MKEENENVLEEEKTNFTIEDADILDEEFLAKAYGGSFQGYIPLFFAV